MDVAERLRRRRERFALTQEWVAEAMGIPRELLSYWETGARTPSSTHLRKLARIYRTTPLRLTSGSGAPDAFDPTELLDAAVPDDVSGEIERFAAALDRWAAFLREDLERTPGGPDRPPNGLGERTLVYDRRRASSLADKARKHWDLGQTALPELFGFLDQAGVLIYRQPLGALGSTGGTTGAFFNHGELGFCAVVNEDATPARQAFTLAHGIAHVLFHHSEAGVLCRVTADDKLERFADAFAEQFLVPGKELRRRATALLETSGRDALGPIDALELGRVFRVSFPTIVMRLASERLVDETAHAAWREIDGLELAIRLGMQPAAFALADRAAGPLRRYPTSVLTTVERALRDGRTTLERAGEVLEVEPDELASRLLGDLPPPDASGRREHAEFRQLVEERG